MAEARDGPDAPSDTLSLWMLARPDHPVPVGRIVLAPDGRGVALDNALPDAPDLAMLAQYLDNDRLGGQRRAWATTGAPQPRP